MNTQLIDSLAGHPLVSSVGWTLVHFVWQAALIGAVIALVLAMMHRASARMRYGVACLGLAIMTIAPAVTLFWLIAGTDSADRQARVETPPQTLSIRVPGSNPENNDANIPVQQGPFATNQEASDLDLNFASIGMTSDKEAARPPKAVVSISGSAFSSLQGWLPWFVAIWILGVLCLAVRLLTGLCRVWRWRREGVAIDNDDLAKAVAKLAKRMNLRQSVRILKSARSMVPAVIGWIRPAILVPASMLSGLTTAELESIIAHELAHIRRYDYLVNLLQAVVETTLFYHPAVWWLSQRIRAERENCCDDIAIEVCGNRVVFARALAHMEEIRCRDERFALAANGGSLIGRIRRIVGSEPVSTGPWWPAGVIVLGSLGMLLGGLWMTAASADPMPATENPVVESNDNPTEAMERHEDDYNLKKSEVKKTDSKTGIEKRLFTDIKLDNLKSSEESQQQASVDMMYSNVMMYTFIPARIAKKLGATELGEIDFGAEAPPPDRPMQTMYIPELHDPAVIAANSKEETEEPRTIEAHELMGTIKEGVTVVPYSDDAIWIPGHLGFYGMNQTKQHVFNIVRIEKVDLGVGPAFGPVNALVLDDANSDFGVLGSNWTRKVRDGKGKLLWFDFTGTFQFMATSEHLKAEHPQTDLPQTEEMQSKVTPEKDRGNVTVESWGHPETLERQSLALVKVLASHTYAEDLRESTGWVKVKGSLVPIDVGVEHDGVTVYKTLMYDIVAVDSTTGKTIWNIEWGKTTPMWTTVSIVELDRSGEKELAVELYMANRKTWELVYKYVSLTTGNDVEPPSEVSDNEGEISARNQDNKELKFQIVDRDDERITRAAIGAFGHGRSAAELVRHFASIDKNVSRFGAGSSTTNMESIVSAVNPNYVFDIASEASNVLFNLPEGSGMRAEFSGHNVEILQRDDGAGIVVTNGRVELIDAGGVIRAWASPDGGAEQLVIDCREDLGEVVMKMTTRRIEPSPDYPDPPVQFVMNVETGAPADEKDPPHRGIRYEIQTKTKTGEDAESFVRMKMKWRYDMKRLAEEAEAESGLTLEELIHGKADNEIKKPLPLPVPMPLPPPTSAKPAEDLVEMARSLGNWIEKPRLRFDSPRYMELANALLQLDEDKRVEVLSAMGKQGLEGQVIALCRMLFEAQEGGEFRRPGLGGPVFVAYDATMQDFPLEPIALIENVPFLIVRGYDLGGEAEPSSAYLEYCLDHCQWTTRSFGIEKDRIERANAAISKQPFWGEQLDVVEWKQVVRLKNQTGPTVLLRVGKLSHVSIEAPFYSLSGSGNVTPETVVGVLQERITLASVAEPLKIDLMFDANTKPEWIEAILKPLIAAEFRQIEFFEWGKSSAPVTLPEFDHLWPTQVAAEQEPDDEDGWGALAQSSGRRSRLTMTTENATAGQPLLFKLEIKNFGDQPATIDLQDYFPYRVLRAVNADGQSAQFTGITYQTTQEYRTLQPGESVVAWDDLDANSLFLLEQGKYKFFAEGGEWAMQTLWRDSNTLEIELATGKLSPMNALVGELGKDLPAKWEVSNRMGLADGWKGIFLTHNPTGLKRDATGIQIWFTDEKLADDFELGEGDQKQNVTQLGKCELGFMNVAAPRPTLDIWPEYLNHVKRASSAALKFDSTDSPENTESEVSVEGWGRLARATGLRTRLTLLTADPKPGQPLQFRLEVKNFGEKAALIETGRYHLLAMKDDGQHAELVKRPEQTTEDKTPLQPGESRTIWESVDANSLYLLEAENYSFMAKGANWALEAWWPNSNSVTVDFSESAARAEKLPWIATGTVTTADGKPFPGVTVKAHAGLKSMFETGSAVTDGEGRYELHFGPFVSETVQTATISIYQEGFFARVNGGMNDAYTAFRITDKENLERVRKEAADVFLPDEPKVIDFVMTPTTNINGMVIGNAGDHLRGVLVSLIGEETPSSSSVVFHTRTGKSGRFELVNFPTGIKFQILVEPTEAKPPRHAWASPPIVFSPPVNGLTQIEYSIDGNPVDFSLHQLFLTLHGDGVNRQTAIADVAKKTLDLTWDGLSTDTMVSARMAFLDLGEKK